MFKNINYSNFYWYVISFKDFSELLWCFNLYQVSKVMLEVSWISFYSFWFSWPLNFFVLLKLKTGKIFFPHFFYLPSQKPKCSSPHGLPYTAARKSLLLPSVPLPELGVRAEVSAPKPLSKALLLGELRPEPSARPCSGQTRVPWQPDAVGAAPVAKETEVNRELV